jgi:hypothetical protein
MKPDGEAIVLVPIREYRYEKEYVSGRKWGSPHDLYKILR